MKMRRLMSWSLCWTAFAAALLLGCGAGVKSGGDDSPTPDVLDSSMGSDVPDASEPLDVRIDRAGPDVLDVVDLLDLSDTPDPSDVLDIDAQAEIAEVLDVQETSETPDVPDNFEVVDATDLMEVQDSQDLLEVSDLADIPDIDIAPYVNGCGGSSELSHEPESPCGPCDLDEWECDGFEAVVCSGETWANGCDSCDPGLQCGLPPDPAEVAPWPLPGQVVSFADSVAFLYEGEEPIQTDAEGLDSSRIGVLRGRVSSDNGGALPGITVSVVRSPETGKTLTRADGRWDLAVHAGHPVVARFEGEGFLPVQREVLPGIGRFTEVSEVVLIALDPKQTPVAFGSAAPQQLAVGSLVSDEDGDRTGVLFFPEGTTAEIVDSDGTTMPLGVGTVRITEYTVGPLGPERMPAELPPSSGYTYAMELSMDEALSPDVSVQFNQPLYYYVENFLGFPVGTDVPVGTYNRTRGAWEAEPDGRVIEILEAVGGKAQVDANGDGWGDSEDQLADLGFTDDELKQLAANYTSGSQLFRVGIEHFTPVDCNYPTVSDEDADRPRNGRPRSDRRKGDPCYEENSIIACENQALGECVPVTGTPYRLCYWSDRVSGRTSAYSLDIELTGSDVPPPLKRVELEVEVAGTLHQETFGTDANQTTTFIWDGLDAYGRRLGRPTVAEVRIGYAYDASYQATPSEDASFGAMDPDVDIIVDDSRVELVVWQTFQEEIGLFESGGIGLPGWSLSTHHYYDPARQHLLQGAGGSRELSDPVIEIIGGTGDPGDPWDYVGQSAVDAELRTNMQDIAVGGDGTVYILYGSSSMPGSGAVVFSISPDGIWEHYAGGGSSGNLGDGGAAVDAWISNAWSIEPTSDGGLLVAEPYRVRRIDASGTITTIGGNGSSSGSIQEGVAATSTKLTVRDVDEGPDGTIYVLGPSRIRAIDTDGILHAFAGGGSSSWTGGNVAPASTASFSQLWNFDVAEDGTMYIGSGAYSDIAAVLSTDGLVTAFAGGGSISTDGVLAVEAAGDMPRVAAGNSGLVYLFDQDASRVRVVDSSGVIYAWAGGGEEEYISGSSASDAEFFNSSRIAVGPQGDLYLTNSRQVLKITSPVRFVDDRFLVPSSEGTRVFEFDETGRHEATLDALLGVELLSFGYDENGLLTSISDPYGNVTSIERDSDGTVTSIQAANGQSTELSVDGDGNLQFVTAPDGSITKFTYHDGSLMETRRDPNQGVHYYTYDDGGRLETDTNPDGGTQTLTRSDFESGHTVTLTSSTGRTSSYSLEWGEDGSTTWTFLDEAGGETVVVTDEDGGQMATYPNGRTMSVTFAPDPRWGDLVPYFSSATTVTPSGLSQEVTAVKEVELADPANPMSLEYEIHTIDMNGRTFLRSYDSATRTITRASPEGREVQVVADTEGRVAQVVHDPSDHPSEFDYDSVGRLSQFGRGQQLVALGYDEFSRLETSENAVGEGHVFDWTDGNQLCEWVAPDTGVHGFAWEDGYRTMLIRPDGDEHLFTHTDKGLEATYLHPGTSSPYQWTYDGDGGLLSVAAPSGRTVVWDYAGMPFPVQITHDQAVVELAQFGTSGQPGSMVRTPTIGDAQSLDFTWDGGLLTALTLGGGAEGEFTYGWDASFQLDSVSFTAVAGSHSLSLGRDDDGLVTALGDFTIYRTGPAGAPDEITDGTLTVTLDYDDYGLLESRSHSLGGAAYYALHLLRDNTGRIVERTETVDGSTVVFGYEWDVNGRLLSVTRDGVVFESYTWDSSGNRDSAWVDGQEVTASYEAGDRILLSGTTEFETDPDGFVTAVGGTVLSWSSRGELASAMVGGPAITYSYDGFSRLTARSNSSGTTELFRGNPADPLQITHVVQGGQLTAFVYDDAGILLNLVRGGATYSVACDQVGTPRVVVDDSGTVVKTIERDSWGNVISDSNPSFDLPIGFAGGYEDPDTGLVHFGFRVYDPGTGRWLGLDPLLFAGGQTNLYLYVRGDPINLVDPSGLFCIGGSYYMGYGAGGSICMTSEGVSYCAETGFGIGGGASVDVFGDLQRDGTYFGASASVDDGLVGAGLSWELDDCGRNSASFDCKVGWITCSISGGSTEDGEFDVNLPLYDPEDVGLPKLPKMKAGLEAKVYGKACASYRW